MASVKVSVTECLNQLLNDSWVTPGWCPPTFDAIACWPETAPSFTAEVDCPNEDNIGIIFRKCLASGEWEPEGDCSNCNFKNVEMVLPMRHVTTMYWIYVVGYIISLLLCALSMLVFMHYKSLSCLRNVIHSNISACFVIHNVFWLLYAFASVHLDIDNALFCYTFQLASNYSITAVFFWMMVEGIYLVASITFNALSTKIHYWMCCAVGWGLPALITLIAIKVDYEEFFLSCHDWKVAELNTNVAVFIFIVNVINVILSGIIIYVIVSKPNLTDGGQVKRAIKGIRAFVMLCPLLGVHYGISVFQPSKPYWLYLVFYYYTVFFSSFQGAAFAIVFCLGNHEVMKLIRRDLAAGLFCLPPIKRNPLSRITDTISLPNVFRSSNSSLRAASTLMFDDNGRLTRVDFKKPKNREPAVEIIATKSSKQSTSLLSPQPMVSQNVKS